MARIKRINDMVFIDDERANFTITVDEFVSEVIQFFYLNEETAEKFIEFIKILKEVDEE